MKRIDIFKRSIWTLLSIFFALLFVIAIVAGMIMKANASWIDDSFGATRYILVEDENADKQDTQYFKSDYAKKDENGNLILTTDKNGVQKQTLDSKAMRKNSLDVVERVNEEGSVLMWNKGSALPLSENNKVSLFGAAMFKWFYHGSGSGSVPVPAGNRDLAVSLKSRKLQVNESLYTSQNDMRGDSYGPMLADAAPTSETYRSRGNGGYYEVREFPWSMISSAASNISAYGDAAIYTISRFGGENSDTSFVSKETDDESYLSLTREEKSIIAGLKTLKNQGLKKIILVINTSVPIALRDVDREAVDACLWVGFGGSASTDAVADLLVGNANPSGHLTDTWAYDPASVPANENRYGVTYNGDNSGIPESFSSASGSFAANDKYLVYQEGIYVGYRYFETRYEDAVLKRGNAASTKGAKMSSGAWDYSSEVAYTFGHGESYTEFEYSDYKVKKSGDNYTVSMTIKNVGSKPGKGVMQVYLQKPYTEYDKTNNVEKAAVELVGFAKTKLLQPGESDPLSVTVSEYEFKSYDSYGKGTYILEKGDYYLAAGKDAHDALNNILAKKGKTVSDGMTANGNSALAWQTSISRDDFEKYSVSPKGVEVKNRFDNTDINRYFGKGSNSVTYLSRSDWDGTYPSTPKLSLSAQMKKELQYEREVANNPEDEMPVYAKETYEGGHLNLIQLRGVPYDDDLWGHLLNQMSFLEQQDIIENGAHKIGGCEYIAAPGFNAPDGPQGIVDTKYIIPELGTLMAFTGGPIVASTFNRELVEEMGKAFGEELMHAGCVGTYGVGANTHRSPYGGRCWEYYSEDGFLASEMNVAESKGLRVKGCVTFTKHFALNDMESFRDGLQVWANEQSVREIYLKAYERAVIDGHTNGIMSAFHRLGTTWTGVHTGLITDLLRGEWAFTGIVETDSPRGFHMGKGHWTISASSIIAGQDVWMGAFTGNIYKNCYKAGNATACLAVRESMRRVFYVMVNSSAMNGISSATRVQYVVPTWEKLVLALQIVSGILAAGCIAMTVISWIKYKRNNG